MSASNLPESTAAILEEMKTDGRHELAKTLEGLGKAIAEDTQRQPKTEPEKAQLSAKVIQLPLWPEDKRGTPNCFLRSALFSAVYGNERVWQ